VFVPTARRCGSSQHSGSSMTANGDYYFVIPCACDARRPGARVRVAAGAPRPGHRLAGVCEQAPRASATATLKVAEAAPALPLRISVERGGGGWTVRLANANRPAAAGGCRADDPRRAAARAGAAAGGVPPHAGGRRALAGRRPAGDVAAPCSGRGTPAGARDPVRARASRSARGRADRWAAAAGSCLHRPWRGPADGTAAGRARPAARDPPDGGRARPGPRPAACSAGRARIGCHIVVVRALPRHADAIGRSSAVYAYRTVRARGPAGGRRRRRVGETRSRSSSGSWWARLLWSGSRCSGRARNRLSIFASVERCASRSGSSSLPP
jgi:hypothetical protein